MMRLLFIAALLPAACSPPSEKAETKPAAAEHAPVPYSEIGWDGASGRFTFSHQPFTGLTVDYHKNGQLKLRYHIKDGVYHGLVEEWYDNGQQTTKTSYENGKHEGDNFYWNRDGSLQVHKVWKDDQLISETPGDKKP